MGQALLIPELINPQKKEEPVAPEFTLVQSGKRFQAALTKGKSKDRQAKLSDYFIDLRQFKENFAGRNVNLEPLQFTLDELLSKLASDSKALNAGIIGIFRYGQSLENYIARLQLEPNNDMAQQSKEAQDLLT